MAKAKRVRTREQLDRHNLLRRKKRLTDIENGTYTPRKRVLTQAQKNLKKEYRLQKHASDKENGTLRTREFTPAQRQENSYRTKNWQALLSDEERKLFDKKSNQNTKSKKTEEQKKESIAKFCEWIEANPVRYRAVREAARALQRERTAEVGSFEVRVAEINMDHWVCIHTSPQKNSTAYGKLRCSSSIIPSY